MELNILDRISGCDMYVFFNPSNSIVTAHFFTHENIKPDVMAYLKRNMSWDIREVLEENSTLEDAQETITIKHNPLGIEAPGSDFDKFVRAGLKQMVESVGEAEMIMELKEAHDILTNNSYQDDA